MITLAKLIPTLALVVVVAAALTVRPPRTALSPRELARLAIAAVVLYLAGGVALAAHRTGPALVAFAAGLVLCALVLWLSRGDAPPPPEDDGPADLPGDPPQPVDFDWSFYEDQLRDRARERPRDPVR